MRFLLPVALTIIVLATVTALLLSAFGDSKGKFDKLVKKGDYEAAWEYAESKLSGDEEVMDQIQQEMGQKVKDLEALYVSEEATLEVTLEEMGQVSKIASVETEAQDAVGRITELSVSREDWASAVAKEEEGDYVAAMGMYDKVVERDANYSAAREKVEACFQAVKSDALQKAEALRAEGRHDEAIQVLGDCQAVREDAEVTAKLTEVLGEKQAIEAQVAEAARLEAERVAEEQRVAAEQRKAYVRGLIRVTRVSCDDPDSKGGVNLYVNFKNMAKEKMKQEEKASQSFRPPIS